MHDKTQMWHGDKLGRILYGNWEQLDDLQKAVLLRMKWGQYREAARLLRDAADNLPERTEAPDENMVERPEHYAKWPLEPTKWAREYGVSWNIANAVKYVIRYLDKFKPKEDCLKAARYLLMEDRFLQDDPEWSK